MMRLIFAAGLAGLAIAPATAGALPPNDTSAPLGSTNACLVVATPALPGTCSFIGAGSGDIGITAAGVGTFTISHQRKVVVCTNHAVSGFALKTVYDDAAHQLTLPGDASQSSWAAGVVFTITINGEGWVAAGGPGTPGADMATEPAVGPGPGYAGAEDGTAGAHVGAAC